MASAEPYASLHLAPDRQPCQHPTRPPLSFLQAGCPSCHPTNSVKADRMNENERKINKQNKHGPARICCWAPCCSRVLLQLSCLQLGRVIATPLLLQWDRQMERHHTDIYTKWHRINQTIQSFNRLYKSLHRITPLTLVQHRQIRRHVHLNILWLLIFWRHHWRSKRKHEKVSINDDKH